MLVGTNQDHGQRYNRRVVFDLVRRHGALSRADIARHAGLSYQSISNMADDLMGDGLLLETRRRVGRRGQPPVELSVNPDGAFSLGFSFDRHRLRGTLVDLGGTPRAEREIELDATLPSVVLPRIATLAGELIESGRVPADRFLGLGLSMPGLSRAGRLVSPGQRSSHPWLADWTDVPIIDALTERVGIPIFTDNDAAAAAIGELIHGEGRRFSHFVYVYISDGIGAGLIFDRRPYRGGGGMAGEFGHMAVGTGNRACLCGQKGCLESYASLNAACRRVPGLSDAVGWADLLLRRDPDLITWVDEAGQALRRAITSVENLLDPEVVFIGGTISEPLLDALMAVITPLPPLIISGRGQGERLLRATTGLGPATLGAAALPIFAETASDLRMLLSTRTRTQSAA